tara:strand:- start:526 stop:1215 length:690 start_codon:yes stop_codon:yes gene_type:complete
MREIKTVWGKILPEVNLFPIYYLLFIYGFIYILPYGQFFIGLTWFDWFRSEDGPLEWLQFAEYLISSMFALSIFIRSNRKSSINILLWLVFSIFLFLIAGEEISWGERITGYGIDSISEANVQGETNFHNLPFFHNYLLDPVFEIGCLILGWFGWRRFPKLDALPSKSLSLFFLFVALFYFYFDISWASTTEQIRNDQEIFEFLLASGLLIHCWNNFKKYFLTNKIRKN